MTDRPARLLAPFVLPLALAAQEPPLQVDGVFPRATVMAPGGSGRSAAGIGALVPWADRLWVVGYVDQPSGNGFGLYEIGDKLQWKRHPASAGGAYANRLVHWASKQVFLGPHAIDAAGNVRTIGPLEQHRLAATAQHIEKPDELVYFLTMEGLLFEVDVKTLECTLLADLVEKLEIENAKPQFMSAHTAQGRLVVANSTYDEKEHIGARTAGRLAEWNGSSWRVVEWNPFVEVSGKQDPATSGKSGDTLYALGWDRASVILRVLHDGRWMRYRLPRGSHSYDHSSSAEWMRIREAQAGHYLMDAFGIFYELPGIVYRDRVWGIKPICSHLRLVPDFCHFRGLLVLAGDQTSGAVGQPQSGLWFGGIDALWRWGKPAGWGGPWWESDVKPAAASDPFLLTGFDHKTLHLSNHGANTVEVDLEIDFLGEGRWNRLAHFCMPPEGYAHFVFPPGYGAHWARLVPRHEGRISAQFHFQ